jgi:uncharacterized coiled-coil protein SlyX
VATLNEKFDRRIDDLEKKNEEQHKDILAAVKFSYAELDRRITTLEADNGRPQTQNRQNRT